MKSACRISCILFCCITLSAVGVVGAAAQDGAWKSTKDAPVYTAPPADGATNPEWNSTKGLSTLPGNDANTGTDTKAINPAVPTPVPTNTPDSASENYAGVVDTEGNAGIGGPRGRLGYSSRRGKQIEVLYYYPSFRGSNGNRWTFTNDFIVPVYRTDMSVGFINPRATFDNLGAWEVNVGGGYRHLLGDAVILGGNLYYDSTMRNFENGATGRREQRYFGQVGTGVEVLSNWVNFHANGYLHVAGDPIIDNYYRFEGPGIWGSGRSITEALSGLDGELGFKIPGLSNYVETWVYGGGYLFWGEEIDQVNGYKARIEIMPAGFIKMNVGYSNDRIDGDQIEGSVAFEIPFSVTNLTTGKNPFEGITDRLVGSRTLKERLVEPVNRDIDVKTKTERFDVSSGLVEEVVFVSESAAVSAGDGTFENPYATILEAMGDARITGGTAHTIHIINDSATDTVPGGTVSVGSLMVWGSGIHHPLYGNITNMSLGYPTVSGTLLLNAPDLMVTGLHIDVAGTAGVDILNTTGLYIVGNIIDVETAGTTYGIYSSIGGDFGAVTDPVRIYNNYINVTSTSAGDQAFGMYLVAGGNMFGDISGNTVNSLSDSDLQENTAGIFVGSTGGNIGYDGAAYAPLTITNNVINSQDTGDLYGVLLITIGGGTYADVMHNTINLTNPDPATGDPDYLNNDWIIPLSIGWYGRSGTSPGYSLQNGSYLNNVPVRFMYNTGLITSNQLNAIFLAGSSNPDDYFMTGSSTDFGYMGNNTVTSDHWGLPGSTTGEWILYNTSWSGHFVPGTIP